MLAEGNKGPLPKGHELGQGGDQVDEIRDLIISWNSVNKYLSNAPFTLFV